MTMPPDLAGQLVKHGFVHAGELPGMAVSLMALREDPLIPSDFTIIEVIDLKMLELWAQVC